jgi:dienelactone hydrolase
MAFLFSLLVIASHALAYSLPPLTGSSPVGTVSLEFTDYTRIDPFVPGVQARDLMISVFYPIQHTHGYPLAKDFTPLYANFTDHSLNLTAGTAENITSRAYAGAKLNNDNASQPHVLIFSPGFGNSRVDYNAKMADLASLGYLVIGIDSTHETGFVDFPDNRTAPGIVDYTALPTQQIIDVRVEDMQFILDVLSNSEAYAKQIPGVYSTLNLSKVGVFGHSLGGSTAASAIEADPRFACGINLDGSFFGDVINTTISKPFMIMSSEGHDRTTDATWAAMWANLKGFKREIEIKNSTHQAFEDYNALYDILLPTGEIPNLGDYFGAVKGARMLKIESAYIGAFFGQCFSGKADPLLNGPSKKFPEVTFAAA